MLELTYKTSEGPAVFVLEPHVLTEHSFEGSFTVFLLRKCLCEWTYNRGNKAPTCLERVQNLVRHGTAGILTYQVTHKTLKGLFLYYGG